MVEAMLLADEYTLENGVTEHFCTKDSPMPIELGEKAVELKQLWHHDALEETGETETRVFYRCNNCGLHLSLFLGD